MPTSVTVLRRGKAVHHCKVVETESGEAGRGHDGRGRGAAARRRHGGAVGPRAARDDGHGRRMRRSRLRVDGLQRAGRPRDAGGARPEPERARRARSSGVAGVSGNGQRELVEALVGQRPRSRGKVTVMGEPYAAAARGEPPPEGAQPARGAVAQRLRRRPERGREHGAARLRPAAAGARRHWLRLLNARCGAAARASGSPSTASRRRARARRSAACPAATCSARCWRASWRATSTC